MKTLVVMLLDESGSITTQARDVIRGFNMFIQDQKEIKEDEAYVTFLKFNTVVSIIFKCVPVARVPQLAFAPNGETSLYDAIWQGVQLVEETESLFDRIVCVIMTDGEDNSSRMITKEGVGHLIKKKEKEGKWTFLYIGENPDKWAKHTGTSVLNTVSYNQQAPLANFQQAQVGVTQFRQQQMMQMPNAFQMLPPRMPAPVVSDPIQCQTMPRP